MSGTRVMMVIGQSYPTIGGAEHQAQKLTMRQCGLPSTEVIEQIPAKGMVMARYIVVSLPV